MSQGLRTRPAEARQGSKGSADWCDRFRAASTPRRILQAGEHLFQAGEPSGDAFIVRTGRLKSYRLHRDGEEQILGMHGPGDVLGYEAMVGRPATCSAVALEIASIEVIEIPKDSTHSGGMESLVEGMYRELQRFSRLLRMDRHPAERRLAEFLLDFSRDEARRGMPAFDLTLPFNRRDLARFLGLAPETLSRTFTRYQEQGILSVDNRKIHVLDHAALCAAAGE